LLCGTGTGTGTGVAGFGLPDSRGVWQGMDVDLCRGLAVAIFNDREKVRFVPLSSSTRFTALGAGEVDVLFRTSTQTMMRDVTLGLRHVTTYFRSINTPFRPVVFERTDQPQAALQAGRCDSFGTDPSQLAGVRSTMTNPCDWTILPERSSKEPFGAHIRRADDQWFDVVCWYTTALIEAEELGVTPELGEALKLDRAWAYNLVRAMGNYGEVYNRSFGPSTSIDLPRGPNNLWTQGGLIYALPMR
jgi:general L-amino acid transport system substrate-binding protein